MKAKDREAVARLREHIAALPPHVPEFKAGTAVRLDTGCIGVVVSDTDDEGSTTVCYVEGGDIRGPAYGYELTRLEEDDD